MSERIADELQGISLGDERLNQRSRKVIETLAADPEASINAATNGWADTQAAYRLFNNSNVSPEQILKPHREATARRICEHPVVLLVQDTTELDYTGHPASDALGLNKVSRLGFYHRVQLVHPTFFWGGCIAKRGQTDHQRSCASNTIPQERISMSADALYHEMGLKGYRVEDGWESKGGALFVLVSVPRESLGCRKCGRV